MEDVDEVNDEVVMEVTSVLLRESSGCRDFLLEMIGVLKKTPAGGDFEDVDCEELIVLFTCLQRSLSNVERSVKTRRQVRNAV
jgi:hypothetical protein